MPHAALCSATVLTMDLIEGDTLNTAIRKQHEAIARALGLTYEEFKEKAQSVAKEQVVGKAYKVDEHGRKIDEEEGGGAGGGPAGGGGSGGAGGGAAAAGVGPRALRMFHMYMRVSHLTSTITSAITTKGGGRLPPHIVELAWLGGVHSTYVQTCA